MGENHGITIRVTYNDIAKVKQRYNHSTCPNKNGITMEYAVIKMIHVKNTDFVVSDENHL